jgi:hypothetical protein
MRFRNRLGNACDRRGMRGSLRFRAGQSVKKVSNGESAIDFEREDLLVMEQGLKTCEHGREILRRMLMIDLKVGERTFKAIEVLVPIVNWDKGSGTMGAHG